MCNEVVFWSEEIKKLAKSTESTSKSSSYNEVLCLGFACSMPGKCKKASPNGSLIVIEHAKKYVVQKGNNDFQGYLRGPTPPNATAPNE